MLLDLEKLRFKGIGRFLEEQVIEFDKLGKFVQLDGKNNNTKGSSGAGKSTVPMVLDYLLGINERPSTILKCRYSDEGIFVEGTFSSEGKRVIVTRDKKLSIDADGIVTKGNAAKTEEALDAILGIPRDLFRKMYHKRQKEGGFFLDMTPAQINIFLMNALGLGHYKAKLQIADDKIIELTKRKEENVTKLTAARYALKAAEDSTVFLGSPPERTVDQTTVLALKERSEKSTSTLAFTLELTKNEEVLLNQSRPQIKTTPFDRTHIENLERVYKEAETRINQARFQERDRQGKAATELYQFQKHLSKLQSAVQQGEVATKKAIEVAEQIKKIKEGKCYTCGQDWVDSQTQTNLMSSIKTLRMQIEAGQEAQKMLPDAQKSVDHWTLEAQSRPVDTTMDGLIIQTSNLALAEDRQREKDHQETENKKNRELLSVFEAEESAMRSRHRITLDDFRGQADVARRAFEAALGSLKAYESARQAYEKSLTSLRDQEAYYGQRVTDALKESTEIQAELAKAEELKRALKSYLSCSFDEALDTVSKNATTLIRHIPNMANATIQLEGIKETQDGKIKEEVNAVIHMDGEENVPIKSLCGGERTATDLAIDLSVIDMLESKANKGINIFFLDEPFTGFGTVEIEMALEVLKNSSSNKRLVIIDHNPEVKEMVESKLTAVRNGATSRIVQSV